MSANLPTENYINADYQPFNNWFHTMAQGDFNDYPLEAWAYLWFEIDQAIKTGSELDNMFVMDYDKETGNFLTEVPDD
jgi:hypothetical protein